MQNALTTIKRSAASMTLLVTFVLERIPKTCTSFIFSINSSSDKLFETVSTVKPSFDNFLKASECTFSKSKILILFFGYEIFLGKSFTYKNSSKLGAIWSAFSVVFTLETFSVYAKKVSAIPASRVT